MDALGSVVASTNASQQQTSDQRFDAFGNRSAYAGFGSTFGFAGKHQYHTDGNSGLLLGHRYYDPSLGRFISQAPAQDDSNWYAYCGNNPLVAVDPNGLSTTKITHENGNTYIETINTTAEETQAHAENGIPSLGQTIVLLNDRTNDGLGSNLSEEAAATVVRYAGAYIGSVIVHAVPAASIAAPLIVGGLTFVGAYAGARLAGATQNEAIAAGSITGLFAAGSAYTIPVLPPPSLLKLGAKARPGVGALRPTGAPMLHASSPPPPSPHAVLFSGTAP